MQAQNPYKSIGKDAEVLTLSNGKYQEFIPNDTLVVIGSVIYNTVTEEVVAFALPDTVLTELGFEPEVRSRFLSMDPYASKYPSLSPYSYVANNPIRLIDPDGRDIVDGLKYSQSKQALKSFAGTDVGRTFLGLFAGAGQTVGGVTFKNAGAFSNHTLNLRDINVYGVSKGRTTYIFEDDNGMRLDAQKFKSGIASGRTSGEGSLFLDLMVNVAYADDYNSFGEGGDVGSIALTMGHEAFMHATQSLFGLVEAIESGDVNKISSAFTSALENDHVKYLLGQGDFSDFSTFVEQLNLPDDLKNKLMKEHDERLRKNEGME